MQNVFALATTTSTTHHAITLAQSLAHERRSALHIVAPARENVTVNSALANVRGLPVDDWDPDPPPAPDALAKAHGGITVVRSLTTEALSAVIPKGATVVLAGTVGRVFRSASERL